MPSGLANAERNAGEEGNRQDERHPGDQPLQALCVDRHGRSSIIFVRTGSYCGRRTRRTKKLCNGYSEGGIRRRASGGGPPEAGEDEVGEGDEDAGEDGACGLGEA